MLELLFEGKQDLINLITGASTRCTCADNTVSLKTFPALAEKAALGVGADSFRMAVVCAHTALINVCVDNRYTAGKDIHGWVGGGQ